MSEVTQKSDNSLSQMRLLGGTPHMCIYVHPVFLIFMYLLCILFYVIVLEWTEALYHQSGNLFLEWTEILSDHLFLVALQKDNLNLPINCCPSPIQTFKYLICCKSFNINSIPVIYGHLMLKMIDKSKQFYFQKLGSLCSE